MKKDIAYEKIKQLYGNCRPYDANVKMYINYKGTNIISYMKDIIKNIIDTDDEIVQLILDCAVMNVLEQLVYMRELYDKGISKSEYVEKLFCIYIRSFLYKDDSSIYHFPKVSWKKTDIQSIINNINSRSTDNKSLDKKIIEASEDILYIPIASLKARIKENKNSQTTKYSIYKYDRIFSVYEDYLVKKSDKGYRNNLSKSYLNVITALFDIIDTRNMKDVIAYNLPEKMPLDVIKKLYLYISQNVLNLNYTSNLSEFMIIERLFGFTNISEIINSDKTQKEKNDLIDLLQTIRFYGYTPLHRYVIEQYTSDENEYFYSFVSDSCEAIRVSMQSVLWSIIKRFKKNDKKIENRKNVLEIFIDNLKKYLENRNITIYGNQIDSLNRDENCLYNKFLNDEPQYYFFMEDITEINNNLKTNKNLIMVLFRKYSMGAQITCSKKEDKYLFEDIYSMSEYINSIFSMGREKEDDFQYKDILYKEENDDYDDYENSFPNIRNHCIMYDQYIRRVKY